MWCRTDFLDMLGIRIHLSGTDERFLAAGACDRCRTAMSSGPAAALSSVATSE